MNYKEWPPGNSGDGKKRGGRGYVKKIKMEKRVLIDSPMNCQEWQAETIEEYKREK